MAKSQEGNETSVGRWTQECIVVVITASESLITSTFKNALSRAPREALLATRMRVRPRDQPGPDLTIEKERRLIASLRQMLTNLGHPSNHALARAIRVTGGSEAAVRAALQLRCDVCERQQHPGPHLPARLRTGREFGDTAAIDLFVLAGRQPVDLASTFGVVAMIPSKHPKEGRVGPLFQILDHSLWRAAEVDLRPRRGIRARVRPRARRPGV